MKSILLLGFCALTCAAQELRVYAIDVEGGKATLYVSPSGQSMLVDAGHQAPRETERIVAAVQAAGVRQIDYLVITHYHSDHVGGVPQLAARMPIRNFVDHGPISESVNGTGGVYGAYLAARAKGKHIEVKAGDRIPVEGIDVQVVTASGKAIATPMAGAGQANPLCAGYRPIELDRGENAHSIGLVITFGTFRVVDLGDLHWNREYDLACPNNLLGTVDVYMTTHHAKRNSGAPALVQALRPKAAIMNNGPASGASVPAWQTIHDSPGAPDIWQLHNALLNDRKHNAPGAFIANKGAKCSGYGIQLAARPDGSFTIRNGRTQKEKDYR